MASFNKVILMGNLTADPELRQTTEGTAVCRFSIAVNRTLRGADGKPETDFFSVVAWRGTAEFVARYFKKGKPILVCGSIQTRAWTDQKGLTHNATDIVADSATFTENRTSTSNGGAAATETYMPPAYTASAESFEEASYDDTLPF